MWRHHFDWQVTVTMAGYGLAWPSRSSQGHLGGFVHSSTVLVADWLPQFVAGTLWSNPTNQNRAQIHFVIQSIVNLNRPIAGLRHCTGRGCQPIGVGVWIGATNTASHITLLVLQCLLTLAVLRPMAHLHGLFILPPPLPDVHMLLVCSVNLKRSLTVFCPNIIACRIPREFIDFYEAS